MDMEERVRQLLAEMQGELAKSQQVMADLEQRQATLRDTMLQIRGAITALEMVLTPPASTESTETVGVEPAASATANGVEEPVARG
jgi:phage gp29-like protein